MVRQSQVWASTWGQRNVQALPQTALIGPVTLKVNFALPRKAATAVTRAMTRKVCWLDTGLWGLLSALQVEHPETHSVDHIGKVKKCRFQMGGGRGHCRKKHFP